MAHALFMGVLSSFLSPTQLLPVRGSIDECVPLTAAATNGNNGGLHPLLSHPSPVMEDYDGENREDDTRDKGENDSHFIHVREEGHETSFLSIDRLHPVSAAGHRVGSTYLDFDDQHGNNDFNETRHASASRQNSSTSRHLTARELMERTQDLMTRDVRERINHFRRTCYDVIGFSGE